MKYAAAEDFDETPPVEPDRSALPVQYASAADCACRPHRAVLPERKMVRQTEPAYVYRKELIGEGRYR